MSASRDAALCAIQSDALLRVTTLLLRLVRGLAAGIGLALAAGVPLLWIFGDRILAAAAESGTQLAGNEALAAISVIMLGGLIMVSLAFGFLGKLIALIRTVGDGSPFIPENAVRLRTMGWLVLAMEALTLLAVPLTVWLREVFHDDHIIFAFSFEGLITALLLFILARVFDHGTRLAQDVEGTV